MTPSVRRAAGVVLAVVALGGCGPRRSRRPSTTRIDAVSGPHFAFRTSTLTPEGEAKVTGIAATLNRYPSRRIEVNGYTDSVGSDFTNQRLSEQRADAVKDALIRNGVHPNRIIVRGYGAANPVASNATAEGRAQNRRVEIVLE
jgi:outer membrane protein OmpA-like peptidoglycan-associated protein